MRGVHGAKVALPFALLTWLISWLPSFHPRFPHTSPMAIHVSHVSSLFWPLVLGGVAGFTGGVRSAASSMWESEWWSGDRWNRWWPGVLAGGAWMAVLAVGLSAAAVIGLGVAHPSDVATYFRTVFAGRPIGGIALVILTALLLPTMAMWVLVPAMGGCVEVSGSAVYQPYCFLGFGSWPGNPLGGIPEPSGFPRIGSAPGWTLVFLVIPLVAVVAGGVMAARRADARGPGEGAVVGALAGAVFALVLMVAAILASAQARFNGPFFVVSSGVIRYGPNPGSTFQLALIWGVLGGAAGGWAARLRSRRPGSRRDPSILVLGGSGR